MTTQSEIRALAQSHATGDKERFRVTLLQIAAHADKESGSHAFANELRRLADTECKTIGNQVIELPRGSSDMLFPLTPKMLLPDIMLSAETLNPINEFLRQRKGQDKLVQHGLYVPRKLLFVGPPGVGKTVTAGAVAAELGLPLMLVQLHSVVESHLGETARNIRKMFNAIKLTPGVYLLDEFDALAGKRRIGTDSADAELNRGLNSLLQFMEEDGVGIVIATTNMTEIIDPAMFRRFDNTITFFRPNEQQCVDLAKKIITRTGLKCEENVNMYNCSKLSYSDIESITVNACRMAVLDERDTVQLSEVLG